MNIDFLNRYTKALTYRAERVRDARDGLERAVRENADLTNVDLDGARLDGARLVGASLVGARLDNASLDGASLDGARLDNASLVGASLDGARLDNASLDNASLDNASLVGASLVGASLDNARLDNASLDGARLDPIRDDIFAVLNSAPNEVAGLLAALRAGKIDGSTYEGECACLVGTIAKERGCKYSALGDLRPDSSRPAECWFMGITPGDTPENHGLAKITEGWILEWQAKQLKD